MSGRGVGRYARPPPVAGENDSPPCLKNMRYSSESEGPCKMA